MMGGAFSAPLNPIDQGAVAPLWTPTTNRPPVGCRQGFRALNREQTMALASSTCTELPKCLAYFIAIHGGSATFWSGSFLRLGLSSLDTENNECMIGHGK